MNTLKLNNIEVPLTEENIKLMREALEAKEYKPWRAEYGKYYYYVNLIGHCNIDYDVRDRFDDFLFSTGNYFKTEEEAEKYKERLFAIGRVTHAILEANEGKIYLDGYTFARYLGGIHIAYCCNVPLVIPYMKSKELAERILKDYEADLKIILGV